jgi:hypothetical protein
MPKVILINSETERDGLQHIGDVVDVYEDDRWMSPTMLEKFTIVNIAIGINTVADVKARLDQLKPVTSHAHQWDFDFKYHFNTEEYPEGCICYNPIDVYQVGKKWYKMEVGFKFPINLANLSEQEKIYLATLDINHPSVNSFINKIVKDLTSQPGNDVEITDLKNQEPMFANLIREK